MTAADDGLEGTLAAYHEAARAFAKGDAEPVKKLFSHEGDVTLANPFGPPVHGWHDVSAALDFASSRFRDGDVTTFERIEAYRGSDLVSLLELEHWEAKVAGRPQLDRFELRVTTSLRREPDGWRIVHRHADPITTFDPLGPLRRS